MCSSDLASPSYKKYFLSTVNTNDILHNTGPKDVFYFEDFDAVQTFFKETQSGNHRAEVEVRLKMMDGSYRWSRMVALFYKDDYGKPSRTIGVIVDIHDERMKRFMLDRLINEMPGGIGVFTIKDTIECSYFSEGFATLSDRTSEEMSELLQDGKFVEKVIAPTFRESFFKQLTETAIKGLPFNMTFQFVKKNGDLGWLHLSGTKMREENEIGRASCRERV